MKRRNKMKLKPLYDRAVVRRVVEEEEKIGSFYVPEVAKEKPAKGKVLEVGEGRVSPSTGLLLPLSIKTGDTVLFGKYSGTEIEVDGEKLLILREEEILAKEV